MDVSQTCRLESNTFNAKRESSFKTSGEESRNEIVTLD
jgi:hypothetical protein